MQQGVDPPPMIDGGGNEYTLDSPPPPVSPNYPPPSPVPKYPPPVPVAQYPPPSSVPKNSPPPPPSPVPKYPPPVPVPVPAPVPASPPPPTPSITSPTPIELSPPPPPNSPDYGIGIVVDYDYEPSFQNGEPPGDDSTLIPPPPISNPSPNVGTYPPPLTRPRSPPPAPVLSPPPPPTLLPPPPPPPPPPVSAPQAKIGKTRRKLEFSVNVPIFSASSLSSSQQKLTLATVQGAALLMGASSPPDVSIVSVTAPVGSTRRKLQATGVLLDIEALFKREDEKIAVNMADILQNTPTSVFPPRLFGVVEVPKVKVKRVLGGGEVAGICIGSVVLAAAVGGMYSMMASRRRRRSGRVGAAGMVGVSYPRPPSKYAWLHKVASTVRKASKPQSEPPTTPSGPMILPELVVKRTISASSDEDLSLRDLYAAKTRMVELQGRPNRGSPPPSMAVSPRPTVAPLSCLSNPRGSLVVFENPLADILEGDGEAVAGHIEVSNNRSSNNESPSPAVMAGWFKEARKKSLEKKAATNLNRRQSFRSG